MERLPVLDYDRLDLYAVSVLLNHLDFQTARADECIDFKRWDELEEHNRLIQMLQDEIYSLRRKTDQELIAWRDSLNEYIANASKGPWDNARHMRDEVDSLQPDVDQLGAIEWELKKRGIS